MPYCTKIFEFSAAHRIYNHNGKCRNLHGHQYKAEITFFSDKLNQMGMVIDFGDIKSKVGGWIMKNWDHNTILGINDYDLGKNISSITGQNIYYMSCPPTAEAMAYHMLHDIIPNLIIFEDFLCDNKELIYKKELPKTGNKIISENLERKVFCYKVKIYETSSSYAEAELIH
ncbi:6-pyruvoyl trahydropterin synthase family protein [Lyticum sinuosum]|uniref:6-carboxy-5,6,7,8-tetrahydropterin synthase n=1 Tax=Lyticum sinuosum TaxID=1332059 RepID=A0AAE5AGP4_9RICK|nr:6-carboxytetrahydropterin synthase [Lyticum sinuosum]MDZ5761042.1 6-pyruvoyl tetrahydropterin synthase [Lyticum sinuosum]